MLSPFSYYAYSIYYVLSFFCFFIDYLDSGDAVYVCSVCKARVWKGEAIRGNEDLRKTSYSICCYNGKVELPNLIHHLSYCLIYIAEYNIMFAFTSIAGKTDHTINSGGSLLLEEGELPKFCQLYIYDTDDEVDNKFSAYEYRER
uniref:Uncharacterized protein n=1 Tax=Lactuca sativa TaxID=4236 RepID=A0A9R1W8B7_LACSA|nr:hypothetical protein LSAT_V11C300142800 [Lactuca sativa]